MAGGVELYSSLALKTATKPSIGFDVDAEETKPGEGREEAVADVCLIISMRDDWNANKPL